MRLGYKHDTQSDAIADRYWNNTVLPLLDNGSLEHAINGTYAYPNRIGLYPGINCQFFVRFAAATTTQSILKVLQMKVSSHSKK
jgi:hypothetical protein